VRFGIGGRHGPRSDHLPRGRATGAVVPRPAGGATATSSRSPRGGVPPARAARG
jgi:hypothetical protein